MAVTSNDQWGVWDQYFLFAMRGYFGVLLATAKRSADVRDPQSRPQISSLPRTNQFLRSSYRNLDASLFGYTSARPGS